MTDLLAAELSSFVGREEQLAGIRGQLQQARLVTLVGFGGCGKTRLALRIARESATSYPGGVHVVELGNVPSGEHVGPAVATGVGATDVAAAAAVELAAARLSRGPALLLVDNCEHVVDQAAEVVAGLLRRCPDLTVLATSREPLRVPGEVVWTVPPMSEGEAAALFVARATASDASADLAGADADVVAICRRLEGIPLAVELAAARVRTVGLPQLAARIEDRLAVLTAGPRTAAPRQRTLLASLQWGYGLLDAEQQLVLRRVSVFVGSFDVDAADAVVADGQSDVSTALADLVDRSWLTLRAGSPGRYRMLETVREFGLRLLAEHREERAVRDRHLAVFHDRIAAWARDETRWRRRTQRAIDDDYPNVAAALSWAQQGGAAATGLAAAARLWTYWVVRGRYGEGRTWLDALMAAAADDADPSTRAEAHYALCWLAEFQGDFAAELRAADAGLALLPPTAEDRLRGRLLTKRGYAVATTDFDAGIAALREALEIADRSHDASGAVEAAFFAGWFTLMRVGCGPAEPLLLRAIGDDDAVGMPHAVAMLGYSRLLQGRITEAHELLVRALRVFRGRDERYWISVCLALLAVLELARGDDAAAASAVDEAAGAVESLQTSVAIDPFVALAAAQVAAASGRPASVSAAREPEPEPAAVGWLAESGYAALQAVRLLADRDAPDRHGPPAAEAPAPLYRTVTALAVAERARAAGDTGAAATLARDVLQTMADAGIALYAPEALDLLARCEPDPAASRLRRAARAMRRDMGTVPQRWVDPAGDVSEADDDDELAAPSLAEAVALATRGRGRRSRPSIGWEALTPAELAVVALVAEGQTNVEIAERLFVSRRTVATHLEHVFTKVGVRTRAELAAMAARRRR